MKDKCELSNEELVQKVHEWVDKMCRTGGRAWSLEVPVNFNRDPDVLITTLCQRFEALLTKETDPDNHKETKK